MHLKRQARFLGLASALCLATWQYTTYSHMVTGFVGHEVWPALRFCLLCLVKQPQTTIHHPSQALHEDCVVQSQP
jgi:hypothetical protein